MMCTCLHLDFTIILLRWRQLLWACMLTFYLQHCTAIHCHFHIIIWLLNSWMVKRIGYQLIWYVLLYFRDRLDLMNSNDPSFTRVSHKPPITRIPWKILWLTWPSWWRVPSWQCLLGYITGSSSWIVRVSGFENFIRCDFSLPLTASIHSKVVPSQWETALLCNDVSQWLDTSLQSAMHSLKTESYHNGNFLATWGTVGF